MPTKDELEQDAQDLGIDTEGKTKAQLEDAIAVRAPDELGPVVPEGESVPEIPAASGSPTQTVQPQTADDIPEAGR